MELVLPAPKIYVTFSKKQQRKALKREGIDCNPVEFGFKSGATTMYENTDGNHRPVVMVCFPELYELDMSINALFAHEAVHVAQFWCRTLDEENPADEEMAYMTQVAMYAILREYDSQVQQKEKNGRVSGKHNKQLQQS